MLSPLFSLEGQAMSKYRLFSHKLHRSQIIVGDALKVLRTLPSQSVQCVITSPPYYGLRDFGIGKEQIGLEATPKLYIPRLVAVFHEANNPQQSWGFEGEPPEAVTKDSVTRAGTS
jgi:hypothetical protein